MVGDRRPRLGDHRPNLGGRPPGPRDPCLGVTGHDDVARTCLKQRSLRFILDIHLTTCLHFNFFLYLRIKIKDDGLVCSFYCYRSSYQRCSNLV